MSCLACHENTAKSAPSLLFFSALIDVATIEWRDNIDNTDDVGLIAPKVGVDSPRRVR